jgi:hypothetical protein
LVRPNRAPDTMIRTILPYAAFALAVFLLWLSIRVAQKERWLLYPVVPLLLLCAGGAGYAVNSFLGYATGDLSELEAPFTYLYHVGDQPTYLLAVPANAAEPRLYLIPELSEAEKEGFTEAGGRAGQGVPIEGTYSEGDFELHDLEGPVMRPKEG